MIVFSCVEKENDLFVLDGHTLLELHFFCFVAY